MNPDDKRLLEASAAGQTDRVLQLIEEHGHQLHKFKDQVRQWCTHLQSSLLAVVMGPLAITLDE